MLNHLLKANLSAAWDSKDCNVWSNCVDFSMLLVIRRYVPSPSMYILAQTQREIKLQMVTGFNCFRCEKKLSQVTRKN